MLVDVSQVSCYGLVIVETLFLKQEYNSYLYSLVILSKKQLLFLNTVKFGIYYSLVI